MRYQTVPTITVEKAREYVEGYMSSLEEFKRGRLGPCSFAKVNGQTVVKVTAYGTHYGKPIEMAWEVWCEDDGTVFGNF